MGEAAARAVAGPTSTGAQLGACAGAPTQSCSCNKIVVQELELGGGHGCPLVCPQETPGSSLLRLSLGFGGQDYGSLSFFSF